MTLRPNIGRPRFRVIVDVNKDLQTKKKLLILITVKPVLKATSEQRPPVYNGQLEPQFSKILY